jgi:hypothetical protein
MPCSIVKGRRRRRRRRGGGTCLTHAMLHCQEGGGGKEGSLLQSCGCLAECERNERTTCAKEASAGWGAHTIEQGTLVGNLTMDTATCLFFGLGNATPNHTAADASLTESRATPEGNYTDHQCMELSSQKHNCRKTQLSTARPPPLKNPSHT